MYPQDDLRTVVVAPNSPNCIWITCKYGWKREQFQLLSHNTTLFFTLSSLFCQLSSRLTINSMQWDKVERIPAVVALKVMASPLKSIPFIALGLAGGNTGTHGDKEWTLSTCQIEIWISGYKQRTNNEQVFYQIQIKKKTFADWLTFFFAAVVVVTVFSICPGGSQKFIFIFLYY